MTQAEIEALIIQAIVELNKQLGPEDKITPASDTILVGDGGKLDSLGLITLMVAIEEACAEKGLTVLLVDGLMNDENAAHYLSVGALSAWIAKQQ